MAGVDDFATALGLELDDVLTTPEVKTYKAINTSSVTMSVSI